MADTSSAVGTWYLNENYRGSQDFQVRVSIRSDPSIGEYSGTLFNALSNEEELLDSIRWDDATRLLEFRRHGSGFWRWYRGTVVEGILVGRYAQSSTSSEKPADLTAYSSHVTGWNSDYLDTDLVPRSYDLLINDDTHARLRLDRAEDGRYIGRFKVYQGPQGEELEYDLEVTHWDGVSLSFIRR